ncbi:MAG: hypothetical protein ACYTG2_02055 [Planctomycetota bacterium]
MKRWNEADAAGAADGGPWFSERLDPGGSCRIHEDEWRHFLMVGEPLHQWGGAFLFDEGEDGCVRVYLRDDREAARHTCVRLDVRRSAAARTGVVAVEAASRRAADVITSGQQSRAQRPGDLEAEAQASQSFVQAAEALYRQLLEP